MVSRPGVPTESSWGGRFYGAVRGTFSRASAGLEGEYTGNQLSIAPAEPGDPLAGRSFIAGLDKNRRLLRLSLQARPSWWAGLSGTGEYSRRTRVDRGAEVAEESRRAQADLTLGPFRLSGSTSEVEVTGGEIPSSSRFNYAALYITPAYWLQMDALVQDEKRTAVGVSGRFRYAEAGIRLRYARLSAYARVRQEETGENGSTGRKNRRIWAGLSRTFGFRVGANR